MNKLTFREKYSYGIGALGKDLAYAIVSTYLMVYFTDAVGLNPAFVGTLFLVARLWDAVNDPAMGMIVDNTRSKFGKFRPWIFIGTVLNAVVIVFLFRKPDLEGLPLYAYFSIMYILWGMTYTIMDIPYWSMIPALTSSKEEREQVAVVIAVAFIISAIITCLNVKERVETPKNAEKVSFKQTLNIIRKNDQLLVFIGIVLGMNLIMQISGSMAIYYFTYVVGKESLFSVYQAFAGIAEISGLVLLPILTKKIGREDVFKFGSILPIAGFLLLFVAGIFAPQNILFIAIAGIALKLGSGFLLGSTTIMLADVVDYGEFKLGTRNESIVFSVQTLLVKGASAVAGWLVGVGLSLVGYVAGEVQSATTILGMRVIMIWIPIVCAIVMYTIYKSKYKINGKFHDDMLVELEKRKKANDAI